MIFYSRILFVLVSLYIKPMINGKLNTIGTIYLKYVFTGPTTQVSNSVNAGINKSMNFFFFSTIK